MKSLKRRKIADTAARWAIRFGGAVTVLVILALFVFIFLEVYPLLQGAMVTKEDAYSVHGTVMSVGVDDHQEVAYVMYNNGTVEFISLHDGVILKRYHVAIPNGSVITSADKDRNRLILGTSDGKIFTVSITFSESFEGDRRAVIPEVSEECWIPLDNQKGGIHCVTSRGDDSTTVTAVYTTDNHAVLIASEAEKTLVGNGEKKEIQKDITGLFIKQGLNQPSLPVFHLSQKEHTGGLAKGEPEVVQPADNPLGTLTEQRSKTEITSLALDLFMENLYAGTPSGELFHINIRDRENPFLVETVKVSESAVTALGFLLGDVSLVVGDASGGVHVWMQVRDELSSSGWALKKVHTLASHGAPVMGIDASQRDKGFVTAAADGTIHLNHATSEQTLLKFATDAQASTLSFSPRANGIMIADAKGRLLQWHITNPHPETTLKTLFGRVWYEGYEKPEFVWQSTGGTDDFEPKLSLTPLIFGTIKGTIYALIIAVPIGIFAALYTSQFLHNSLKIIKPVIEIMAALPSVILGFLAGLWLAPFMERIFPAIIIMPFFITLSIVVAIFCWKILPVFGKGWYRYGIEAIFLIPFIIGAVYISIRLGGGYEALFLEGDYREWLSHILGLPYDQRNALLVGIAMGFAVIPLIFTISEDAMSNVPNSLRSASLALGATPWQTAVRVVLPTASPGIFSAVMIGFGRAVGETMIVLMATGNTPIMDWNLFNGFRALSANIAVEIPEAPHGGTLYRVLFLASLLLFVTTFVVNTVAETVRQRMKLRYSKL
ncbi:MAG: ABC transporter permease [Candidatus Brocadia sp. WS118]|nr:MAG: ABC transporter permease [Candidatus Brocadia sp. WS118]